MLRQACPQLALACLTACVRQLESLSPDQLALVAFLSTQTHLRLNIKGADQMRALVRAGVARAPAMTALSLTQFMFGAVASGGLKPAHMQVGFASLSAALVDWLVLQSSVVPSYCCTPPCAGDAYPASWPRGPQYNCHNHNNQYLLLTHKLDLGGLADPALLLGAREG